MVLLSPAVSDRSVSKVQAFLWILRFGVLVHEGK